jgi:large subunit ribosomal protein L25
MSETILNVEKRQNLSKQHTKELRRNGKIPGIYYIHGEDQIPLEMDEKELRGIIQSDAYIIDLQLAGNENSLKCVIRDVQWEPIYGQPLHVDFLGIKLTEKVMVDVPIRLTGTAVGVKLDGGVLQHIVREISVEGLPLDIPEFIELDVSELEIGDSIRVDTITIDKVDILTDPIQALVAVRQPTVLKEEVPVSEEVEEGEEGEAEVEGEEGADKDAAAETE